MRKTYRGIFSFLFLWVLGCGALQAAATGPGVRDDAGVFSTSTVKQADEAIRKIQKQFHKDLLVETFAGVPEGRMDEYTRNREEFFSSLVRDQARSAQLDGIYVLVMKEPPPHRFRIQVGVGQVTRQRAFTVSNRDELVRILQTAFRQDRYDEGLQDGISYVERTLRENLRPSVAATGTPSTSRNGSWGTAATANDTSSRGSIGSFLVLGVVILGGMLLVRFLFRMMRGTQGGQLAGAGGMGGGGGGFLTSLLGGIGGVMAGSWLYDRFMGGNAHASDSSMSGSTDTGGSDVGGDFSSSGGDVDFGGGGDFGGDGGGGGDA